MTALLKCKSYKESSVAEYLSATTAGLNTRLIVVTWKRGDPINSVGLVVATIHTCGRHICIVPDEVVSRSKYHTLMKRSVVSEGTETAVGGVRQGFGVSQHELNGCRFCVQNAMQTSIPGFKWHRVLRRGTRVVRSVFLPIGRGLDIAHVVASGGGDLTKVHSRWIKHVDPQSGEEHLFKRK